MNPPNDHGLGDFPQFMVFNVVAIALCGCLAVARQSHQYLLRTLATKSGRRTLLGAWLATSLLVGGQMCWLIRPFFGVEGTAEWDWPWFTGSEPGFRGARSFYEAVLYLIVPPDGSR